ncbi:hypothetical protein [uncultured Adlercreutzia sp.]|uniref:hypothetical protein n=1 Tax=uncultured Adlercreutzia sp. TaxID=875803 RepID=UPI0025E6BE68|nr:hypothetical protein [uncultured Adlercreutzia sp.]MCI9262123.1 hypothetical protein [Eggerthellaceae bacterium]
MDWNIVRNKEDVARLLARVEGFHDWYVAGFSYDPLAQSEDDDLNLGRFKVDVDALTITFRWDSKSKSGKWPEVQLEFRNLSEFHFGNFRDPDPIWNGVLEETRKGWVFVDDDGETLSEEERAHPETIRSSLLVICGEIRWRPLAVVTTDGPDWWNN